MLLNKIIYIDSKDLEYNKKLEFANSLKDVKLFTCDFNEFDIDKQFRLLRETYPISLSYNKHNYLPYFELENDINEAFDILEKLWRDDCQFKNICSVNWSPTRSSGNLFPEYVIIGLNPGIGDYLTTGNWGTFLSGNGPTTITLRNALDKLGILHKSWLTNLVRCSTKNNDSPKIEDTSRCYEEWLKNEINILKPSKKLFTLGRNFIILYKGIILENSINIKHPAYYCRKGIQQEYYKEFERYL